MEVKKRKKQFSLSMLMRIFLAIIVVVSLIVFANSVMRYNQLLEEEKKLEAIVNDLHESREALLAESVTADEVAEILSSYKTYQAALNNPDYSETFKNNLKLWEAKQAELRALLNESENREYIEKLAREKLGLYYPDEEIYY